MSDFKGWECVADQLEARAAEAESLGEEDALLDEGQCASIRVIAEHLRCRRRALLVADEVGMGKTRIAVALIDAVRKCGGRAAVVMPAGLGVQWQAEFRLFDPNDRTLLPLRSYESFIRGFSREGDDDHLATGWQERRDARLADQRQQRELPEGDWRDEEVLMISHTFARMAFPAPVKEDLPWRRELMPAFEALCKNFKRNMQNGGRGERRATHRSARAAYETLPIESLKIETAHDWRGVSSDYYRRAALPVIGRALGRFDLVVIDEAHKARGVDSSLSRILGPLIWESEGSFRLGMTATPVELDADQWLNTLKRLVPPEAANEDENADEQWVRLRDCILDYARIAKRLRNEPIDESVVAEFEDAAKRFVCVLAPYVIRRDKRSDKELKAFQEKHKMDYRDVRTVLVDPAATGHEWLRALCAAEAISLLPATSRAAKQHRLMLEKGHGLDNLILKGEADGANDFWFRNVLLSEEASIFEHPAILAAVNTVESATAEGRKVLVFGTFVRPLQALTQFLDARAMLRHLAEGSHWSASRVPKDMTPAVEAALKSLSGLDGIPDTLEGINLLLEERYSASRRNRRQNLDKLHRSIVGRAREGDETASLILQIWPTDNVANEKSESKIGLLLQALDSRFVLQRGTQIATAAQDWTTDGFLDATQSLISEIIAGAADDFADDNQKDNGTSDVSHLDLLLNHLSDYSGREGSFARLLYGQTAPQTRRLLQAAFNRTESWPMVLVAQSTVGREGLNLHEECRTVVLLHAEWNPAVVEQQIGRVDRKNSRFLKDYRSGSWRDNGGSPPRIEIHCIQISGGYDSLHWSVLSERWASLRAQLHGDVVNLRDRENEPRDQKLAELIHRLDSASPSFFPTPLDLKKPHKA